MADEIENPPSSERTRVYDRPDLKERPHQYINEADRTRQPRQNHEGKIRYIRYKARKSKVKIGAGRKHCCMGTSLSCPHKTD